MEIITFVKGSIPVSKIEEFELEYETLKQSKKPEGMIASYLLEDSGRNGLYIIETVWASQKYMDKMRNKENPVAVGLFTKFGVNPIIQVYNMVNSA